MNARYNSPNSNFFNQVSASNPDLALKASQRQLNQGTVCKKRKRNFENVSIDELAKAIIKPKDGKATKEELKIIKDKSEHKIITYPENSLETQEMISKRTNVPYKQILTESMYADKKFDNIVERSLILRANKSNTTTKHKGLLIFDTKNENRDVEQLTVESVVLATKRYQYEIDLKEIYSKENESAAVQKFLYSTKRIRLSDNSSTCLDLKEFYHKETEKYKIGNSKIDDLVNLVLTSNNDKKISLANEKYLKMSSDLQISKRKERLEPISFEVNNDNVAIIPPVLKLPINIANLAFTCDSVALSNSVTKQIILSLGSQESSAIQNFSGRIIQRGKIIIPEIETPQNTVSLVKRKQAIKLGAPLPSIEQKTDSDIIQTMESNTIQKVVDLSDKGEEFIEITYEKIPDTKTTYAEDEVPTPQSQGLIQKTILIRPPLEEPVIQIQTQQNIAPTGCIVKRIIRLGENNNN